MRRRHPAALASATRPHPAPSTRWIEVERLALAFFSALGVGSLWGTLLPMVAVVVCCGHDLWA